MGRVRGAVNARALSLARKAVDLCNCWRREATAECLVEKQVELVSFGEDPIMVVATLRLDVALAGGVVERPLTTELSVYTYTPNEHTSEGGRDDRGVPYHAESTLSSAQVLKHSGRCHARQTERFKEGWRARRAEVFRPSFPVC